MPKTRLGKDQLYACGMGKPAVSESSPKCKQAPAGTVCKTDVGSVQNRNGRADATCTALLVCEKGSNLCMPDVGELMLHVLLCCCV